MEYFYNKPFIALIGDIKKSKVLKNRNEIQEQLRSVLEDINKKYNKDITAKFLITLGDEFQGLLREGKNLLKIIEEIKMKLYPVELRFGIGVGNITTDIDSERALGADGPGYYCARDAIILLKAKENKRKTAVADIYIKKEGGNGETVELINTVFELMYTMEKSWTDRQREIIWDMLTHQDGQLNTANRLAIRQSTVYKALSACNYYVYKNALEKMEIALGEIQND